MRRKVIRIMAYLYMPLFFTLIGYGLIYITALPALRMLRVALSVVLVKDSPESKQIELKSIYNPVTNPLTNPRVAEVQEGNAMEIFRNEQSTLKVEKTDREDYYYQETKSKSDQERIISIGDIQFPEQGNHFANLSCERIELDAPVYWGDTNEILKVGVGQYTGSFLPGLNRSILLSGHNTSHFKPLQLIEEGDVITYQTNYGIYEYQVTDTNIYYSDEAEKKLDEMLSHQEEKLIMYTCYPFETLVGTRQERLFIFADKISGPLVDIK